MTMPLVLNQSAIICQKCRCFCDPATYSTHLTVCGAILKPTIPPPPVYGLPQTFTPVSWENGWSDLGGQSPLSGYRATLDNHLQLVIAAAPGTVSLPMFHLSGGWIPPATFTQNVCIGAGAAPAVVLTVQGTGSVNAGAVSAVTASIAQVVPSVQAVLLIPLVK